MQNRSLSKLENENLQKYLHYIGYKSYEYNYTFVANINLELFPKSMFENIEKIEDITYNLFVPVYNRYNILKKIRVIRDNEFNFVLIDKKGDLTFIDLNRNLTSQQIWNFIYLFPKKTKTEAGTFCPMNKEIAKLDKIKIIKNSDDELSKLIDIYISNYDFIIEKLDDIIDIINIEKREEESLKLFNSYSNNIKKIINKYEYLDVKNDFINTVTNINEAEELFNILDDNSNTRIEKLLLLELENSNNSSEDIKYCIELYFKATGQILKDRFSIPNIKKYLNKVIDKNTPIF